jgi:hypothetical protein
VVAIYSRVVWPSAALVTSPRFVSSEKVLLTLSGDDDPSSSATSAAVLCG